MRVGRADRLLLGPYAARTCPVKTQNAFDPRVTGSAADLDESTVERFDGRHAYRAEVLDRWAREPGAVDLRRVHHPDPALRAAADGGAPVILGARLPDDPAGHRTGRADALVRGPDRPDGRPGYHPAVVAWHRITEQARPAPPERPRRMVEVSFLADPGAEHRVPLPDRVLRLPSRASDFLQLAHLQRMLAAAGLSAPGPLLAAVLGTDEHPRGPLLAWLDLDEPLVRTFSRHDPEGWRLRSIAERYDHEHAFRVDVARRAGAQTGRPDDPPLLVRPVVNDECGRCPWWDHCRPQLDADDVSLRIAKGPLDVREIVALRRFGVTTVTDLAAADPDELARRYLPEVTHRAGAEVRLRVATRRAGMLLAGRAFDRETTGPIEVAGAQVEVDFDLESSASGRVYLWGFLVDDGSGETVTRQFTRFGELDAAGELALAREALGWLSGLVREHGSDVKVYHYSGYEVGVLAGLLRRSGDPILQWAWDWSATGFVDLLEVVKQHFFGVAGLGLKSIAAEAGFAWRDDDPGGLNSQRWFAEAVHAEERADRDAARRRVLEYNEDDVIATHRLRGWLRAQ